jgi:signal transduction histidine kinase
MGASLSWSLPIANRRAPLEIDYLSGRPQFVLHGSPQCGPLHEPASSLSDSRVTVSAPLSSPAPASPAPPPPECDVAAETTAIWLRLSVLAAVAYLVTMSDRGLQGDARLVVFAIGTLPTVLRAVWLARGRILWRDRPLAFAAFDGLWVAAMCGQDGGLGSSIRFVLLPMAVVTAVGHPPRVAAWACGLYIAAYSLLIVGSAPVAWWTWSSTVVRLAWLVLTATATVEASRHAGRELSRAIEGLRAERSALEIRVDERTRELQESQALIVQGEKQAAFGLLAAGIAHEVGNPLAAISSLVQLLRRKQPDVYTRERLEMIDDQLRRIHRTLQELVAFSRPASAEPSTFPPREAVDAALDIAKYYKRTKGKRVVTRHDESLPPVTLPRDQLVQVMLNLVLNAMDATEEGGCVEISVEKDADAAGWVRVNVSDDGHGIREQDRAKVFQPYFTTKPNGTGLGLFVCRRIVEQSLGGRLTLEASAPGGTTFAVRLPPPNAGGTDTHQ